MTYRSRTANVRKLTRCCTSAEGRLPTGSLMVAAAIGFFAGSAIRRMTHSCVTGRAKQDRLA